jgi:hypothetical protein
LSGYGDRSRATNSRFPRPNQTARTRITRTHAFVREDSQGSENPDATDALNQKVVDSMPLAELMHMVESLADYTAEQD